MQLNASLAKTLLTFGLSLCIRVVIFLNTRQCNYRFTRLQDLRARSHLYSPDLQGLCIEDHRVVKPSVAPANAVS